MLVELTKAFDIVDIKLIELVELIEILIEKILN